MESKPPEQLDKMFCTWEMSSANISVSLYWLLDDTQIPNISHCWVLYRNLCITQFHLGECRAQLFAELGMLRKLIPHPLWGTIHYTRPAGLDAVSSELYLSILGLWNETSGFLKTWEDLGITEKLLGRIHLQKAAISGHKIFENWKGILNRQGRVKDSIDVRSLFQETSHTLYTLGKVYGRIIHAFHVKEEHQRRHQHNVMA